MSEFRQYEVTPQAAVQGRDLGLGEFAASRIARMARRSAPVTHKLGNRRFEEFVLKLDGSSVVAIARLQPLRRHVRRSPEPTPPPPPVRKRLSLPQKK
jgi:hypothetical protein